jgi:carbon-monoxide dehydrogenase large subunit
VTARFVGVRVPRSEDARLLTGHGRYVANLATTNVLHAAFVRSSSAHAHIRSIDTALASSLDGVVAVITADDLATIARPFEFTGGAFPAHAALAGARVRLVGDPIALVVATTPQIAADAAELVEVDLDPISTVVTIDDALDARSEPLWDELGSNVVWSDHRTFGNPDDAFADAAHVVTATLAQHRVSNAPLEPRGLIATFDRSSRRLAVETATQNPQLLRATLASLLGLPVSSVRVVNGDIGGSFGQKGWVRPEDVAVAAASMMLGRPVRWIETRTENLTVGGHARDERAEVELAFDANGCWRAMRCSVTLDQGAYAVHTSMRNGTLAIIRTLIPSAYRLEHLDFSGALVATNKGSYVTYRGPWAAETWIRERSLDIAARTIGIDPIELRRRNLVDEADRRRMITGPTLRGITLRSALEQLAAHPRVRDFRARQAEVREEGRYLGMGVSVFIEPAPGPPDFFPSVGGFVAPIESSAVRMEPDGSVTVTIIQTPSGQGHETTYAMVVADELGIPVDRVRVQHGDTAFEPFDYFGSGGSRSAQKTTGATREAARAVRSKILAIAASMLEANPDDLVIEDGHVSVQGTPTARIPIAQVATIAWMSRALLPPGVEPGLSEIGSYENEDCLFSQGVHCCFVEVDVETGGVTIEGYLVYEDCGDVIHPEIVDDQIRGGVMQGIATVLYERHRYDEAGNLLTGTLVDYLMPGAPEAATIEIHHVHGSQATTVNHRGVGEGGAIAAPAAVTNAIEDALAPFGVSIRSLHITPEEIVSWTTNRGVTR